MFKHTQTIRQQQPINCLSVFDHFVGLAFKVLRLQDRNSNMSWRLMQFYTLSGGHCQRTQCFVLSGDEIPLQIFREFRYN